MSEVVLALDPSTKQTGYALFVSGRLTEAGSFKTNPDLSRTARQYDIANKLCNFMGSRDLFGNEDVSITSEEPMVQGRNGLALHKLLGALEYASNKEFYYIHPSTVKKQMGSGKLDKLEVALAAGELLKSPEEQEIVASFISEEDFDATDAVAIGLCFCLKEGGSDDSKT